MASSLSLGGAIILTKRSLLGKYWFLYISGFTVQMVIAVAVLVPFFASTNYLAKWFFNFVNHWAATLGGPVIFNFIIDWAAVLSAVTVCMVVIPAFIAIMESRRKCALTRMHKWAMNAFLKLTTASTEESIEKKLADWDQRLRSIIAENDSALADARAISNGLKPKVKKAVDNLLKLEECINNHTETDDLSNLLQATVLTLKEISNITYHSLNQSHQSVSKKSDYFPRH
jgi:hypothetical protein